MNSDLVVICMYSRFVMTRERDPGGLIDILPYVTNENEYSFRSNSDLGHGHCLESEVKRRPYMAYRRVWESLPPFYKVPYVEFIDLSFSGENVINEIERMRRFSPLGVFVLYGSDDEYERCLSTVPDEWKLRLSHFFRYPKFKTSIFKNKTLKSELRTFLDAVTSTAIEKIKNAQISSAFISYSHRDKEFAHWLYDELRQHGIQCWLDEKQLRAGDRIHSKIEGAILERDKVLLCASEASLTSWWVDNEINSVIAKEQELWKKMGEESLVLIPLNLDGFMFSNTWKSDWKNQIVSRIAPDFTKWKKEDPYSDALISVIRALIVDKTVNNNPFSQI